MKTNNSSTPCDPTGKPASGSARKLAKRAIWLFGVLPVVGVLAATFIQTNWNSGVPSDPTSCTSAGGVWSGGECVASDVANQTGWTSFSNKDTNMAVVNGGADLQLATVAGTATITSATDFSPNLNTYRMHTSDMDFTYGATISNLHVSGGKVRMPIITHSPTWLSSNAVGNTFDVGSFSRMAVADLDNDGDYDLMVGEISGYVYGYENTGTDTAPSWAAKSDWNTVDVGSYVGPALADLDKDGDFDLLVGDMSGITYAYENIGGKTSPKWTARTGWNLPDSGYMAKPALADLDGDGDYDVMVGDSNGLIYGYENIGSATAPAWLAKTAWNTVDLGDSSAPVLGDLDFDGKVDIFSGVNTGVSRGYRNTGSISAPVWTYESLWVAPDPGWSSTTALADLDGDGDLDVVIGGDAGNVISYRDSGAISYATGSGTLTSAVIDTVSNQGFSTLNYSASVPLNTALSIDVGAGDTAVPDGSWTWLTGVASGDDITALGSRRYVQYRINLSSSDAAVTPSLSSIDLNYNNYPLASNTVASPVNSDDSVALKLNLDVGLSNTQTYAGAITGLGYEWSVHVNGNYAYLTQASYNSSWDLVRMIDITNPTPSQVATYGVAQRDVFVSGDYAYVAAMGNGLVILQVATSPASLTYKSTYNTPGTGEAVHVAGNYAYVADGAVGGLQIIDISDPLSPQFVSNYNSPGNASKIFVDGNYAYLADGSSGLAILDVSTPATPVLKYTYPGVVNSVFVFGKYAYVAGDATFGVKILDVSNPASPVLISSIGGFASSGDLYVTGGILYFPTGGYLRAYDISNPATPVLKISGYGLQVTGVWGEGRYAYLTGGNGRFNVGAMGTYATSSYPTLPASGSYTSAPIDVGPKIAFTTLNYAATTPTNTNITLDVRSGDTLTPNDGTWTAWQTGVASGGDISGLGSKKYIQYRANFWTSDSSVAPSLQSVSINYSRYASSASLVSSAYNTTSMVNFIDSLSWTQTLPAGTDVQIQIRTAPNNAGVPGAWSAWSGPDSSSSSYWNSANTFAGGCSVNGSVSCTTLVDFLRDELNDQWFEYKVTLTSTGSATPTLSDIATTYDDGVVNGKVSITPTSGLTTSEAGDTATFDVVLTSAPSADVFFSLYSLDATEGAVSPSSLTFTSSNWNAPQTVTVTGVDDPADDDDTTYTIVTTVTYSADAAFNRLSPSNITVVNTDNDTAGVTVTPTSGLQTTESGGTASFDVVLDTVPTSDVTINLSSSDTTEGTVSPASVTFNSTDWNVPKTVTAAGVADTTIDGDIAYTIQTSSAISSDSKYSGMGVSDVDVTNIDTSVANISYTTPFGAVTSESGGFITLKIKLTSQPTGTVSMMLSSSDTTEGRITTSSLSFDASNWNVAKTIMVYGVADTDIDGNITYNLVTSSFTSTDANFHGVNPLDIPLTNQDDDAYVISTIPDPSPVTSESGDSSTFYITIGAPPSSNVTVNLASSDTTEGVPTPSSVTFVPGGVRTAAVVVKGLDDRIVDGSQTYTITTSAVVTTDPNYVNKNPADVTFTNTDNDQTIVTKTSSSLAGFGNDVALADVNCDGTRDLLVRAGLQVALFYGSGSNFAANFSWRGNDGSSYNNFGATYPLGDLNGDGCEEIAVTAPATHMYSSALPTVYLFYGSPGGFPDANGDGVGSAAIDSAWKVAGASTSEELGNTRVVAGDFNGDGKRDIVMGNATFTNGQSNEGRIYVFYNDPINGLPAASLTNASWVFESNSTSGYAGADGGLRVADFNSDGYDDLIVGVKGYTNGQSGEGRVLVFYGSNNGLPDAGADKLAYPSDASWQYESNRSSANFGAEIAIVNANGDLYDDMLVGVGNYTNGQSSEGAIYVFHGGESGLPVSPSSIVESNITYDEMGGTIVDGGDFNNDGYGDVISGKFNSFIKIYPGSASGLLNTPIFYYSDLLYRYGVGSLGDISGDGLGDIYVSNDGSAGSGITPQIRFLVSNALVPGFTATPSSGLYTSESGASATFTVRLNSPPTSVVTIPVSSSNAAEGVVAPASLTFDTTNWNQPQTVTVTGINDAIVDGDVVFDVVLGAAVSSDSGYNGKDPSDVVVANVDNDIPQSVSIASVSGSESSAGSFTIVRAGEITDEMSVNYTVLGTATPGADYKILSGVAVIPVGSASVTIPVEVINDYYDENNETVIVSLASGVGYVIGSPSLTTLTITDDDTVGVDVWPTSNLVTTEAGGSDNFYVVLSTQPTDNVTINLTSSDSSEGAPMVSSLVFTPNNWSVQQAVTVVGVNDALSDGNIDYSIVTTAVSSDTQYNSIVVADVSLINRDDESLATVSVIASQAQADETGADPGVFTLTRSGSTAAELRVFYSVSGTAMRNSDYYSLSSMAVIPAGSSSVTIMVTPIQDAQVEGDETVIMNLAPATDYIVGTPSSATVTINDDDGGSAEPVANFAVDQMVSEGKTVTVNVYLSAPVGVESVTIPYTVSGTASNPGDHNATSGSFVINSGDSNTSVSFNVVTDVIGEPEETVVFTLGTPVNAVLGARTTHIVTIEESNGAPQVNLTPRQGGVESRLIITGNGQVTVTAAVDDPNPNDTHSYDWSGSNVALTDINDGDAATFVFNPVALSEGYYRIRLTVTDNGTPPLSTEVDVLLQVKYSAPVLSNALDSDNDGITDDVESYKDSDGDGMPDYLDSSMLASNELAMLQGTDSYIMRAEAGLILRLGTVAFAAGANGTVVSVNDIAAYGGGEGDSGTASAQDTVPNSGGYVDFEIANLEYAGQTVRLVVPQMTALPSGARYRKYDPTLGWRDFVVDANNALASAPGTPGECPLPGDASFTGGLTAGHYCIQLTLEDGGPNDTDGIANLVIADPGQIGSDEVISDPGTSDPGTSDPGTSDPGTSDPGVGDPGTSDPGVGDPGVGDPGTSDPGAGDPGTGDPGTGDPGTGDPGTSDPGAGDPGTSDPGAGDPGAGDPGAGDPGTSDPGTSDPGAGDPGAGDPGTGDPGASDPGTSDPGTSDPGTSDPDVTTGGGTSGTNTLNSNEKSSGVGSFDAMLLLMLPLFLLLRRRS